MSAPYKVWDTRKSLGIMRDVQPAFTYWLGIGYSRSINSTDEWIDFEKLPAVGRKLAPFVRPLAPGKAIYTDQSSGFRFKPAYVKMKDVIDPLMPLVKRPGIDRSMIQESELSPDQRRDLIRSAMTIQHVQALDRRREWLAAKATIDGKVVIAGEDYPAVELDFRRAADHTVIKLAGTRWGDAGVSIFDDIQRYADRMFNAPFGGFPTRLTVGTKVWAVMRKDEEFMKHMDTNIRDPRATVERGVISADKVVKVGELMVGGASGATIDIYLYRDTYIDDNGIETPFMEPTDIVLTGSDERINGYVCHGAIIDPYAKYQALDIFPRNWMEPGDPAVEYILHQSAPLIVPVNPNATLKATVVAP
jgi:hypothetical protein